jgi:hypothetical protein
MNLTYLKDHLVEELEGSKEYIVRAIEIKAMDPHWGKMFYDMSVSELSHASNFYSMAQDYYAKVTSVYKETPDYMDECMDDITEYYTKWYADLKRLQELYSR